MKGSGGERQGELGMGERYNQERGAVRRNEELWGDLWIGGEQKEGTGVALGQTGNISSLEKVAEIISWRELKDTGVIMGSLLCECEGSECEGSECEGSE